jgi:hypothetical protein
MRATEVITKWKIAIPLAIIIIVSVILLTGFTLMHETQTPETVMGEAVTWEIERPTDIWGPKETVENAYMDDGCSLLFDILIDLYSDARVSMVAKVEANVSNGYIRELCVSFNENYNLSQINLWEPPDIATESENLRTGKVVDWSDGKGGLGESLKGYVEAVGVNKPNYVYCRVGVDWFLRSSQNQSHSMEASLQLIYNNGTTLKEAVLPIVLKLASDAGDTLETAKEIGLGNYTGWHDILIDPEDFYKVWIDEGKTVKIQLSQKTPLGTILDLYLYNTSRDLVASSCSKIRNHTEEITYTINQTGWWYIHVVNADSGRGLYTLSTQEAEPQ